MNTNDMKDKLESFIDKNRDLLNTEVPSRHIWRQVEMELDHRAERRTWIKTALKIAAVGFVVFSVGLLVGIHISDVRNSSSPDVASKMEMLKAQENQLIRQVDLKINAIQDPKTKDDIKVELNMLDNIYQELKVEMENSDNGNMDLIINEMIKNHQTKLEMLEFILQKQKRKNHDQISI